MNNAPDLYSYSPQAAVESSHGIIVSNDVSSDARDVNQLKPQIIQAEKNIGYLPEDLKIIADNYYYSSKNLNFLKKRKIKLK